MLLLIHVKLVLCISFYLLRNLRLMHFFSFDTHQTWECFPIIESQSLVFRCQIKFNIFIDVISLSILELLLLLNLIHIQIFIIIKLNLFGIFIIDIILFYIISCLLLSLGLLLRLLLLLLFYFLLFLLIESSYIFILPFSHLNTKVI